MMDPEEVNNLSNQELWDRLATFEGLEKVEVLYELSRRCYLKDEFKVALTLTEQAKEILLELKDLAPSELLSDTYFSIAYNYERLNEFKNALTNAIEGVKIIRENNLFVNQYQYETLINCYEKCEQFEKANEELENLGYIFESNNRFGELCETYLKISINLQNLSKTQDALNLAKNARLEAKKINDEARILNCEYFIAKYEYELGLYNDSLQRSEKLVKALELFDDYDKKIKVKYLLAQILYVLKDYKRAEVLLEELSEQYFGLEQEEVSTKVMIEQAHIQVLEHLKGRENKEKLEKIDERLKSFKDLVEGIL